MEIIIRKPTLEEEFEYLGYVLHRLPIYQRGGYSVSLPQIPEFKNIIANPVSVLAIGKEQLFETFRIKEYDPSFYDLALVGLEQVKPKIVNAVSLLAGLSSWGFKFLDRYEVVLTKYGPRGSYNDKLARIILMCRRDGTLKSGSRVKTILHEIVHIGVGEELVKKYKLTHLEKERLVDLICKIKFKDFMPSYPMLDKGDRRLDSFVLPSTLGDLPEHIKRYVQKYPR